MATFTPPTAAGRPTFFEGKNDPANRLARFYGSWAQSQTVWKDALGNWHQSIAPYQGGTYSTIHDSGTTTTTVESSVDHLADAVVVYYGGHVYELTSEEEADLISGGFGDYIE